MNRWTDVLYFLKVKSVLCVSYIKAGLCFVINIASVLELEVFLIYNKPVNIWLHNLNIVPRRVCKLRNAICRVWFFSCSIQWRLQRLITLTKWWHKTSNLLSKVSEPNIIHTFFLLVKKHHCLSLSLSPMSFTITILFIHIFPIVHDDHCTALGNLLSSME